MKVLTTPRSRAYLGAMMHRIKIDFELVGSEVRMLIDGVYPGKAMREPRVAEKVSTIAAIPEVRQVLVQHQRSLTKFGSLVMEGRDIGTVVFPDTPHKFYLDAKTGGARVAAQTRSGGDENSGQRGRRGAIHPASATRRTRPAASRRCRSRSGATVIENSQLTVDETAKVIVDHMKQQGFRRGSFGPAT